jgi:2-iminobutanoate/2-iminopropanoate deaminase
MSKSLTPIIADNVAPAVGPYSHAMLYSDLVFCSGNIALNRNAHFLGGTPGKQAKVALENLDKVLIAAGSSRSNVIKTTVFLINMDDFEAVNAVYASFFGEHRPARSCIAVAQLPFNACVEIEAIAK